MKDFFNKWKIEIICLVLILLLAGMLFGFAGFMTLLLSLILFFIPTYLIIDTFNLSYIEKITFSLFLGLGIPSILIYYFNLIIPSLKISAIVVVVLLVVTGICARILKK